MLREYLLNIKFALESSYERQNSLITTSNENGTFAHVDDRVSYHEADSMNRQLTCDQIECAGSLSQSSRRLSAVVCSVSQSQDYLSIIYHSFPRRVSQSYITR